MLELKLEVVDEIEAETVDDCEQDTELVDVDVEDELNEEDDVPEVVAVLDDELLPELQ